jgi:hypothetical protein
LTSILANIGKRAAAYLLSQNCSICFGIARFLRAELVAGKSQHGEAAPAKALLPMQIPADSCIAA